MDNTITEEPKEKLSKEQQEALEYLQSKGYTPMGMVQKEGTDWIPKPHLRYKPVSRSRYRPHKGLKQMRKEAQHASS